MHFSSVLVRLVYELRVLLETKLGKEMNSSIRLFLCTFIMYTYTILDYILTKSRNNKNNSSSTLCKSMVHGHISLLRCV